MRYYVYRHIRLDINEIFYIGVGSKKIRNKHNNFIWKYEIE